MKLYLCVSIALSLLGAALSSSLDGYHQMHQRAYDDLDAQYSPSDWTYMQDDDIPETDSAELEANEVDSNAELDEYMNEIWYQVHKPRMDDEVELQSYLSAVSCTMTHSKPEVLHGSKIVLQVLYEKRKWLGCAASPCVKSECPKLYMDSDDWKNCWGEVIKIYRAAGPGNVKVGDVVGLNVGGNNWFSLFSGKGDKSGCPGNPSLRHGFDAPQKWEKCWAEVFKIYAKGKYYGDTIQDHDHISLYYIKEKKWVAFTLKNPGTAPCLGQTRPPPSERYDTCWGDIFELWLG